MLILDSALAIVFIVLTIPVFFSAVRIRRWEYTGRWVAAMWVLIFALNILVPELEHIHLGLFSVSIAALGGRLLAGEIRLG